MSTICEPRHLEEGSSCPYLKSQQELNAWNKYNNTNFNWCKPFSALNLRLLEFSPALKDRETAQRMTWETECKANQVFAELWSITAENNSMDQRLSKYGLETRIILTGLGAPPPPTPASQIFWLTLKGVTDLGWVPEICIFHKHWFFSPWLHLSHMVQLCEIRCPAGKSIHREGNGPWKSSPYEIDYGLGQLWCTKRSPKESSTFTLTKSGLMGTAYWIFKLLQHAEEGRRQSKPECIFLHISKSCAVEMVWVFRAHGRLWESSCFGNIGY